jgi:hypothetical protein
LNFTFLRGYAKTPNIHIELRLVGIKPPILKVKGPQQHDGGRNFIHKVVTCWIHVSSSVGIKPVRNSPITLPCSSLQLVSRPTVWLTGAKPQAERPVEPVLGGRAVKQLVMAKVASFGMAFS